MDGLEVKVSVDCIKKFIKTPNQVASIVPAEIIAFENALVV